MNTQEFIRKMHLRFKISGVKKNSKFKVREEFQMEVKSETAYNLAKQFYGSIYQIDLDSRNLSETELINETRLLMKGEYKVIFGAMFKFHSWICKVPIVIYSPDIKTNFIFVSTRFEINLPDDVITAGYLHKILDEAYPEIRKREITLLHFDREYAPRGNIDQYSLWNTSSLTNRGRLFQPIIERFLS